MSARTARTSTSLVVLTAALLAGCSKPPGTSTTQGAAQAAAQQTKQGTATEERDEPADPSFIGRVWISTTPGSARGSIMIFLPDRSLLMDSCFETFRISKWGVAGDHIRWIEDTIPIEAQVTMLTKNEMRLEVPGHAQTFVAASVPYTCPDMPGCRAPPPEITLRSPLRVAQGRRFERCEPDRCDRCDPACDPALDPGRCDPEFEPGRPGCPWRGCNWDRDCDCPRPP
jgi:hypothetical protein